MDFKRYLAESQNQMADKVGEMAAELRRAELAIEARRHDLDKATRDEYYNGDVRKLQRLYNGAIAALLKLSEHLRRKPS